MPLKPVPVAPQFRWNRQPGERGKGGTLTRRPFVHVRR